MATTTKEIVFRLRNGDAAEWVQSNRILADGEPGVESDTHKFKIGDGFTPWLDLPYYLTQDSIALQIQEAIANGTDVVLTPADLEIIANQVAEDMVVSDLVLLWQNAKA